MPRFTVLRPGLRRSAAVAAFALLGGVGVAGTAGAHVTVRSYDDPAQGGYGALTFRVPTERDDASTTKVEVTMPADNPIASVSTKPHPGWKVTLTKTKPAKPLSSDDGPITEVVSSITWSAESPANGIKPGQFDEFEVSVGPMPKVSELRFPAVQTYSDGEVVKWNETAAQGAPEPEHPAPSIELRSADTTEKASTTTGAAATSSPATKNGGTTTTVLAVVALVIALGAAGAGALAFRKKAAR